jgi:hypothetical protein
MPVMHTQNTATQCVTLITKGNKQLRSDHSVQTASAARRVLKRYVTHYLDRELGTEDNAVIRDRFVPVCAINFILRPVNITIYVGFLLICCGFNFKDAVDLTVA